MTRPSSSANAKEILTRSRALWNRNSLDLRSLEVIAQILDRGEMRDWQALYELASHDAELRALIHEAVRTVSLPFPAFWLAALASLGEAVDYDAALPQPVEI